MRDRRVRGGGGGRGERGKKEVGRNELWRREGEIGVGVMCGRCTCAFLSTYYSYSVPHEESRKLIFEVFVNLVCHGTC